MMKYGFTEQGNGVMMIREIPTVIIDENDWNECLEISDKAERRRYIDMLREKYPHVKNYILYDEDEAKFQRDSKREVAVRRHADKLYKRINRRERRIGRLSKPKPPVLVFLAKVFGKLIAVIGVLWSLAGLVNLYFAWQIYRAVQAEGWQGLYATWWIYYIVGYVILTIALRKLSFWINSYAA